MSSAIAPASTTFRRRKPRRKRTLSTSSSSVSDYEQDDWAAHNKQSASPANASSPALSAHKGNDESPSLLTLPMEIIVHHLVPQLNYPSLLALRLVHPRFYHSPLLYPPRAAAIRLRVAWLLELGSRGLWPFAAPQGITNGTNTSARTGSVDIATDQTFLSNGRVQAMLREERSGARAHASSWLPRRLGMAWDRPWTLRDGGRRTIFVPGVAAALLAVAAALMSVSLGVVAGLRMAVGAVMDRLIFHGT